MLKKLPDALRTAHKTWHSTGYTQAHPHFTDLATHGQAPHTLVISCCDSRVQPTEIFTAQAGELFVHRNIANIVPSPTASPINHATASAIEYAVVALQVAHILVLGHTQCGGIGYAHTHAQGGEVPALDYVDAWLAQLKPLAEQADDEENLTRLNVRQSVQELSAYPFVAERVEAKTLTLHGAIFDIARGALIDCAD